MDNWCEHTCPACNAPNWRNYGDYGDVTGPDPAPATRCHACGHLWIETETRESLEDEPVFLEELEIGTPEYDEDDRFKYATLDEWLASPDVHFDEGVAAPGYVKDEPRDEKRALTFLYTNYRGETTIRHAVPLEWFWGHTEFYPEDQWLVRAYDLDKQAERTFAVTRMLRSGAS